jgi:hypothetical protein
MEEPRRWCKEDGDPEEETWWDSRPVYIESFVAPGPGDGPTGAADAQRQLVVAPILAARKQNETLALNISSPKAEHSELQSAPSVVFASRRTIITEEELAGVALDTFADEEEEDDFELDWDEDEDSSMDATEGISEASTPIMPSTPVVPTRSLTLPVAVPSTPRRRQTMPISPSSVTLRSGSFQASPKFSTTPVSPPIARSVTRARGFALPSPRTELVL